MVILQNIKSYKIPIYHNGRYLHFSKIRHIFASSSKKIKDMTQKEILSLHRLSHALSKVSDSLIDIDIDFTSTMSSTEMAQLNNIRLILARLSNDVTNRLIDNLAHNLNSH